MLEITETYKIGQILSKAALHYSEKVKLAQKGLSSEDKALLGAGVDELVVDATHLIEKLPYADRDIRRFLKENNKVVRVALTCFISDVEGARKRLWTQLGAEPELRPATEEIDFANQILAILHA